MDRLVQARDSGAPGIALVEQGLDTALQMLLVASVVHAMNQPEFSTNWRLGKSTLKMCQADRSESHPGHQR